MNIELEGYEGHCQRCNNFRVLHRYDSNGYDRWFCKECITTVTDGISKENQA